MGDVGGCGWDDHIPWLGMDWGITMSRFATALVLLFCVQGLWAQESKPGKIPASIFAKGGSYESVSLSPDGRYLAVSVREDSNYALMVFTLPERKRIYAMRFGNNSTVGRIDWTSKERMIISMGFVRDDREADAARLTGELVAVNADGTGWEYLFGFQGEQASGTRLVTAAQAEKGFASLVDALPDSPELALVTVITTTQRIGNYRYYVSDFTPLYRLNVNTGKRSKLVAPPMREPGAYLADAKGEVKLVSGTNDDSYSPKTYWHLGNGEWEKVPVEGEKVSPLRVSKDGRKAYFRVNREGDRNCLVEWLLPSGKGTELAAPKDLYCRPAQELGTVYFSADDRPYGYAAYEAAPMVLTDRGPAEAQVTAALQEQFPGQVVYLASASNDGRKMLFFVYSDRNSGEYYLFDANKGEATFFDATQNWVDPEQMAEVRTIRYKARDGLEIEGYLTLPPGRPTKNLPMVVMPHGGPIAVRDTWRWEAETQFLASRGYAVLQMNYRGSSGYGADFEQKGYGEWAGKIIDDITDGARWSVAQGIADPKRLCIAGWSYGGYAALMSVIREPNLYRCAVGAAGAYDLNLLLKDSDLKVSKSAQLYWQDSTAKTAEERAELSPVNHVDGIKAALFIVHGERDIRTPVSQAKALRAALDKAGKRYEWHLEESEGHGFFNQASRVRYFELLEAFLAKNLGGH